jgi:RNA polymerase sigma-70 factor (ECF subfamily)
MTGEMIVRLVLRAQSGDRVAFDALTREFRRMVMATVLQRIRNQAEAEDVSQDVFLRAFRKLQQLQDPVTFPAWLRQIADRQALNRLQRLPRERQVEDQYPEIAGHVAEQPLEQMLREEEAEQLHEGLSLLPALDRDTLWAFYFEGCSLLEMAANFDRPVGTIKRRLHTARGRLRDVLSGLQPA